MKGQYPGISPPTVLGSDGAVLLKKRRCDLVSGSRVVLYPAAISPFETVQRSEYEILAPRQAMSAEEIRVPKETVYACPVHLNDAGGVSRHHRRGSQRGEHLFSRGCLKAKERVLITGIGGGVGEYCAQLASSANADVYVTSSTDRKPTRVMTGAVLGQPIILKPAGGVLYENKSLPDSMSGLIGGRFASR